MDVSTENALLRIAWTTAGFSTSSRRYATKLFLQDGYLTTLLTDYRQLYVERVRVNERFSALNAKLSAPDGVLVSKIGDLFAAETSKCDLSMEREVAKISLESTVGKRAFRWKFEGRLIDDGGDSFHTHVVRPLLDMLSVATDLHRLEFLKEPLKLKSVKDAFTKPQVRHLYEMVASSMSYSKQIESTDADDRSLSPTPPPTSRKRSPSIEKQSDESGSMPPTPPPVNVKAAHAAEGEDNSDVAETLNENQQRRLPNASKPVTPKKPKLRF
ncbi:unnamed protein product [Toxocara canis]|uniref:NTF2 domain-containing protein n=1 Tax=Toxocara canis TaxID=6265 RepID=A0A183V9J9_TOXCA|nr:unnamed protein product [Toxocara canis]